MISSKYPSSFNTGVILQGAFSQAPFFVPSCLLLQNHKTSFILVQNVIIFIIADLILFYLINSSNYPSIQGEFNMAEEPAEEKKCTAISNYNLIKQEE